MSSNNRMLESTNTDQAWEEYKKFMEYKNGSNETPDEDEDTYDICINNCGSTNFVEDYVTSERTCAECVVIQDTLLCDKPEWTSYSDEGGFGVDKARCSYVSDHIAPFGIIGTNVAPKGLTMQCKIDGVYKTVNLARYNNQLTYTSKQKSFHVVSNFIKNACERIGIPRKMSDTARVLWSKIVKQDVLLRGSPRRGIIACCLKYACIYNNCPRDSKDIAAGFCIDIKEMTKGDKIFRQIFENSEYCKMLYTLVDCNQLFGRYISDLGLPFSVQKECTDIETQYSKYLDDVNTKSQVAGIITYVIKEKLKMKVPTKAIISETLKVCNPTINKVVKKIVKLKKLGY